MCCELLQLAFLHSIPEFLRPMLSDAARQWVARTRAEGNAVAEFMAGRLIVLAACAAFGIAPLSVALSGFGLPGSYGAAMAIALTFMAIPFIALGWLSLAPQPLKAGVFAVVSWAALSGSLVAISPLIAAVSGAMLFAVAASGGTLRKAQDMLEEPASAGAEPAEQQDGPCNETRVELTPEGRVRSASGPRATVFASRRLFVDHVHLADRIEFQRALSDIAGGRSETVAATLRLNLSEPGEGQNFGSVALSLSRERGGLSITVREAAAGNDDDRSETQSPAKQRFLATVSHELRTPLNSIIGFSDILRQDLFGPMANERQREYVDLIHSSGTHLLQVVNTILDVSKIDAGTYAINREPFDLNATVAECASMMAPQARDRGVAVKFRPVEGDPEVMGDRRAVKQIVINLLSNAVKFTGRDGVVSVDAAYDAGGFTIRVRDTGIGMSGDELALVGKPFAQADNSYTRTCEGTGLGLAVVKGLVGLHGGSLDIESETGSGTIVSVFIPRSADLHDLPLRNETEGKDGKKGSSREQGGTRRKEQGNVVRLAG